MKKPNIQKLQEEARKRHIMPDLMLPSKEVRIMMLARTLNAKVFFIDAQVGERIKKPRIVVRPTTEENTVKKKMREDREDVPLRVLYQRTDHSERSDEFYKSRPPAQYSNSTPYGIAQQMLQEQLNEENSFRLARKRKS